MMSKYKKDIGNLLVIKSIPQCVPTDQKNIKSQPAKEILYFTELFY